MLKEKNGKMLMILLILLLAFNLFFLLYIHNSLNEKHNQLGNKYFELSNKISDLQNDSSESENEKTNETINFLKQEYTKYSDFADNDRESFMNLVSLFFVALGVLVTGGIIVLYWIFGETKNEVKENADSTIKSSIDKIKNEADSTVKNSVTDIEQEAIAKIKSLIDPKIQDFEAKYNELERFLVNQHSLRKSRVIVLSPKDKIEEMEELEIKRIDKIVEEVKLLNIDNFEEFNQAIENKEVDIIVYRYEIPEGQNEEKNIRKYINKLEDLHLEIPLVVYATMGTRVEGEDLDSINNYPFSVIANMPTSLTSNMMSLANVLSFERGK